MPCFGNEHEIADIVAPGHEFSTCIVGIAATHDLGGIEACDDLIEDVEWESGYDRAVFVNMERRGLMKLWLSGCWGGDLVRLATVAQFTSSALHVVV